MLKPCSAKKVIDAIFSEKATLSRSAPSWNEDGSAFLLTYVDGRDRAVGAMKVTADETTFFVREDLA